MIVGIVTIAVVVCGLIYGLCDMHRRERSEWTKERRELTDRAIARHAGEVIALDRANGKPAQNEPKERIYVEGLS